jgi:hypothetical protein
VDESAASIVKRIFQMTIDGKGPYQIARILHDEQIIRPSCHVARLSGSATAKTERNIYRWTDATISNIIRKPEYMGSVVNFRTYKTSFKSKKHKKNPPEKWEIFENVHEAIISPAEWETAQKCRTVKRRSASGREPNPLTGLVYCADCGSRMYNHRGSNYSETRPSQDSYCCTKYSKYPPECTRHSISVKALRELILAAIQNVSDYVRENEAEFVKKLRVDAEIRQDEQAKAQKKQLAADKRRVTELDKLIQRIYEDKVAGSLTEKRFAVLSNQYEGEQETLEARIAESEKELAQFAEVGMKAEKFIALVRRYTSFEELTPKMLNELVDRVVVHEAERPRGQRNQQVDIFLTYIGQFTPPGCEQVFPEYQSPEEKRREYQRNYYQRNKEKILAECTDRYAAKKAEKHEPPAKSAEEVAAEEAERKEHRKAYQREYQREWQKKRREAQGATLTAHNNVATTIPGDIVPGAAACL